MPSPYPTWFAGQSITAEMLAASLTSLALKATNQTSTSATLLDDAELFLPVAAGGIYRVRFVIYASSASATPDLKTAWAAPSGASGSKFVQGPTDTAASFTSRTNTTMRASGHQITTAIPYQLDTAAVGIEEEGIVTVGSTAGVIRLQFAQNTANATATTVQAASYMTAERLG